MHSVRLYFLIWRPEKKQPVTEGSLTQRWLSELSSHKQVAIRRLLNEGDRMASLIATRLLKLGAQHEEVSDFRLCDVQYPESGKPYWPGKNFQCLDFNISHSDNLIMVAVSKSLKVGVDAEKIRPLKRLSFKMVMLPDELDRVQQNPDSFFELWSKKEAVVKAANTPGISRMRDVKLLDDCAVLDEKSWYLKPLDHLLGLSDEFSVQLATSSPVDELIIENISLQDLIN